MTPFAAARRFAPDLRGSRRWLLLAGLLLLTAAALDAVGVFVLSDVIDGALNADDWHSFAVLAVVWLALTAASSAADCLGSLVATGASEATVLRLRTRVFARVQQSTPVRHRRRGLGDLVVRLSADIEALEHLIASGLLSLVLAGVNIIGLLIAAYLMSPIVATAALCAAPALWSLSALFSRAQRRATRDEREANSDIAEAVHTALTGHETTVAYNRQQREADALHRQGRHWARARIAETRVEAGFGAVTSLAEVVLTMMVTLTAVWQVRQGALTVGQLMALTGYLAMLYPRLQELAELRLSVASTVVSAERIAELLDEPAQLTDRPGARPLPSVPGPLPTGRVIVENLHFARDGRTVLDGVDLRLDPGGVTALLGASGAGKSTLAALLTRMETPDAGRILLDGHDLATATGDSVRDRVTLLPQVPMITPATVAENIGYGRPGASRAQIVAAAVDAGAHDFITDLPAGYATLLDGGGLELSGGQRQRLAIARALLRDTPVLILDEPSAALDDEAVAALLAPLRRLAAGRSTLLITHDPRLLPIADEVRTLRAGRLLPELGAAQPS